MKRLIALSVVAVLLAGCSSAPALGDLPVANQQTNRDDRLIYLNPDQFPNVVAWCDGTTRLYVTSREAQPFVAVPNSPECRQG
jgi:PBP1b-binding outer membrane lipoprotein LpoB